MRPSALLFPIALLCALASPSDAQDPPPPGRSYPDRIVAVVEGVPITFFQLDLECRIVQPEYRDLTPGSSARREMQRKVLDQVLEKEVLVQRARTSIKLSPADEKRLELDLRRQAQDNGGEEAFRQKLSQTGIPYTFWVQRQRRNLLVHKLVVNNVSRDIFVQPAEIRRFYELNKGRFKRKGVTRLRQLVFYKDPAAATRSPLPAAIVAKTKTKWRPMKTALEARQRLIAGEEFHAVWTTYSMDAREELVPESSRPLRQTLEPPLGLEVEKLRPGEISRVIPSPSGHKLYVILLVDRRLPGYLPFQEVQPEIERDLKEAVWQRRLKAWISKVKKRALIHRFLPEAAK